VSVCVPTRYVQATLALLATCVGATEKSFSILGVDYAMGNIEQQYIHRREATNNMATLAY
jgi:hypothetical protein